MIEKGVSALAGLGESPRGLAAILWLLGVCALVIGVADNIPCLGADVSISSSAGRWAVLGVAAIPFGFGTYSFFGPVAPGTKAAKGRPVVVDARRSSLGKDRVELRITHGLSRPVRVAWVNYEGALEPPPKEELAPGEHFSTRTFVTHPWLVMDTGTGEPILLVETAGVGSDNISVTIS